MKVTVTRRAELDARADFFTTGEAEKLVYCASPRVTDARARLEPGATVVDGGNTVEMRKLSIDLAARGVERLMVEGGGKVHTQFSDRRPRRRAAAGHRSHVRGRLAGSQIRARRPLPLEPRTAGEARRRAPDRRRGAAALRPLAAVPGRLTDQAGAHRGPAAVPLERDLEHRGEDPREQDRQRQDEGERDEESGTPVADPAGHDP